MFSFVFIIVGLFCRTLTTLPFTHKLSLTFVFFYSLTYLAYLIPANGSFYFVPNSSKTQNLSLRRFWGVSVYACVCVCVSASACGWDCLHYQVHLIVYILSALPFKSFLIIISLFVCFLFFFFRRILFEVYV